MNDDHSQNPAGRRAERQFRKEMHDKAGAAAWTEYNAGQTALREKTARLKELRLAQEAAVPKVARKVAKPKRKSISRSSSR